MCKQYKGGRSKACNRYLSWLGEVAALQASAEVLQLHCGFRGLPALQGFTQAALWAGSTVGQPSTEIPLCHAQEMMSNVLATISCALCMVCSLPERVCILCDLCWKHFQRLHLGCQLDLLQIRLISQAVSALKGRFCP